MTDDTSISDLRRMKSELIRGRFSSIKSNKKNLSGNYYDNLITSDDQAPRQKVSARSEVLITYPKFRRKAPKKMKEKIKVYGSDINHA